MTDYIKGPWKRVAQVFVDDSEGKTVALPSGNSLERLARANLIASAPELLRLLRDLVDACDGNYRELTEECNLVIASAEGRGEG